jgi:hypothetical protein
MAEVRGPDRKKQVKSIQVSHTCDLKVLISTSVSPTQIKSNPTNTNKTVRRRLAPEEQSFVLTLDRIDMVDLILELCILDAHVLFLEGHLPKHGRAPVAATFRALHCLPDHDVLGP